MSYPSEPTSLVSRYTDGDALRLEGPVCPSPILPITMPPHSPVSSPSWDMSSESSAESGLVSDVSPTEHIPEQIGLGGMYYDHLQHGHYQHRWEFPDTGHGHGHGHGALPRILERPTIVPVLSSPHAASPRGDITRSFPGHGNEEIAYTDEANTKLSNRIRRRCFNCKATETSTWRRSVLSPGKLLCNKCGLFERTHAIPRPKKFPRRRTHSSKTVRAPTTPSDMRTPAGDGLVHRHSKHTHTSSAPITTHLLHALDPISGEIFPQHMPWNSQQDSPDATSARVGRCYPTTEPPAMYHSNGQLQPTVLQGAIWI